MGQKPLKEYKLSEAMKEKTEEKVCKQCGQRYQARTAIIFSTGFPLDGGLCLSCRTEARRQEDEQESAAKSLELAKTRHQWRHNCGIGLKFMTAEFGTFEQKRQPRVFKACLEYAEGFPLEKAGCGYPSMILYSRTWGVGKTHLVIAVAHHILNRWKGIPGYCPVHITTEPDLFQRIQATYNHSDREKETEEQIYNELAHVPLLIIDDIGKTERRDPSFVQSTLFAIIDKRYRNMLPIVLTANKTPDELCAYLGGARNNEASYERLIEMAGGQFIELSGESYRKIKKEGNGSVK